MNLKNYFSNTSGLGVMSTADASGAVNSAIYARPHILANNEVAFIMRDRLTKANLASNPNGNFMFIEKSDGVQGVRLNLHKVAESQDQEKIRQLSRRKTDYEDSGEKRFLVTFTIKKALSLVGGKEISLQ